MALKGQTIPYTDLSWYWAPPCLILTSWSLYFLSELGDFFQVFEFIRYVRPFDSCKSILYIIAAYISLELRLASSKITRQWLIMWILIWLMLLVEVLARGDVVHILNRHYTYDLITYTDYSPSSFTNHLGIIFFGSEVMKPMWAFGLSILVLAAVSKIQFYIRYIIYHYWW